MNTPTSIKIQNLNPADLRELLDSCDKLSHIVEKTLLFGADSNLGFQGSHINNRQRLEDILGGIQDIINRIT